MNRRHLLLFAPSFLMFVWAGANIVKKHRQNQEAQMAQAQQMQEATPESFPKGSRMPASIPTKLPALKMDEPLKDEPKEELHSAPIEDMREARHKECHFGEDCQQPDVMAKSQDLEKLQDYAERNCAGKSLSSCDAVMGDLTLDHENPMYIEARHMMTLSCENDSVADCAKVSELEEHDGNFEAARDYADYSCSHGNSAACKHITLMDIATRL